MQRGYYYTRDHLGSVREMCNSSGSIVSRYSYDPYGAPPAGQTSNLVSGSNLATKQYAGMYMHLTSELSLTKFRAFDPSLGRWLSRDPISEEGGLNLYEYVENNPAEFKDILGESKCSDFSHTLVKVVQEGGVTFSALSMAMEMNYAHNKKWQCDCFLPWLTQGHQGGEVYAHVLGHVAAILADLDSLSDQQLKQDQSEYARAKAGKGGHAPEKEAEILDDVAARKVARALQLMDNGIISPAAAEAKIKELLCDPSCGS